MKAKQTQSNDLAGKFKFTGSQVLRVTEGNKDLVFVPGETYDDLPNTDYINSLVKQAFLEPVKSKNVTEKLDDSTTNLNSNP